MPGLDHSCKIIAQVAGQALARVAHVECDTWKPLESTLQATTERLADRVFLASRKKQRFVVYMEFVTSWTNAIPWSILGKSGMLAERERLPVMSLVYVLQPHGYKNQQGTMRLTIDETPIQQVWFHEIRLWEVEPADWWENEPGLMPLLPLCRQSRPPEEIILHAAERIEAAKVDFARRADLFASLGLFGRLVFPKTDVYSLIGRQKMRESNLYQEILDEGAAEAIVKDRRERLLRMIDKRFGKRAAKRLRNSLDALTDADRLEQVYEYSIDCESIDDLQAELGVIERRRAC